MEQNKEKTSILKLIGLGFIPYSPKQVDAIKVLWMSKLLLGSILFLLLFTLRFLAYLDYCTTPFLATWFYTTITALMIITLAVPMLAQFMRRPLNDFSKFLVIIVAISLTAYASFSSHTEIFSHHYFTSAFILYMLTLIYFFEAQKMSHSNQLIEITKAKQATCALKKEGKTYVSTPLAKLLKGDCVKVPAGDVIPQDGVIISGTTSIDPTPITGEGKPVLKTTGDRVVGGTINRDSEIAIEISCNPSESVLETIISYIQNTKSSKFPIYKKFTWFVFVFSLIGFISSVGALYFYLNYLLLPLDTAISLALSIFLSFSFFSLSTSILITTNIFRSNAISKGILFKDIKSLKTLDNLDVLFLDKTGTLTQGHYQYSQYFLELGTNQGQLLTTFFSLAENSQHPLAEAMETHPWYPEIRKCPVDDIRSQAGLGMSGYIKPKGKRGYFAAMGNLRYLKRMQMSVSREMKNKIDDLESMGETVLLCGYDRQVCGVFSFADALRPNLKKSLKEIQQNSIELVIITGHSEDALLPIVNDLNIKKVYSRCTPEEKASKIEKEVKEGNKVGFVGGVYDTVPFEKANLNFTIDTGTDISNQKADIFIMGSNIELLAWLISNTKKLSKRIRIRTTCSILCSLTLIGLSGFGLTTPHFILTVMSLISLVMLKSTGKEEEQYS
jgi:cation transport ATPase